MIIDRIVRELYDNLGLKEENVRHKIGFILSQKSPKIEDYLKKKLTQEIDKNLNIFFFYQKTPEGTAHAIYCAKKLLQGQALIVFSDTLFFLKKGLNLKNFNQFDGAIFVKEVKDPSQYGIVEEGKKGIISNFIEKPKKPTSNLAIIGVYFFQQSETLLQEIEHIISNRILEKKEYQLTTALKNLCKKGKKFHPVQVQDWLDCGNPKQLLITNKYLLKNKKVKLADYKNTTPIKENKKVKIIHPVYIGTNVLIQNSTIGPNVSIEEGAIIKNTNINNSIIQRASIIKNANLTQSIIGHNVVYDGQNNSVIIGAYSNLMKK